MIYIGSDHRGIEIKNNLIKFLEEKKYLVEDVYPQNKDKIDYPKVAFKLGEKVRENKEHLGILICNTGIGMSIACNKVKEIRCAKVSNSEEAKLSREHNNANVIALSIDKTLEELEKIVEIFINTEFSHEERHQKRIDQIINYEIGAYDEL